MVLSLHPFRVPWVVLSLHPLRCILKVFVKGTLFLLVLLPWMVLSLHPLRLLWVVLSLHPLRCILEAGLCERHHGSSCSNASDVLSLHPLRRILDFLVKNGIPLRFGMPQMVLSLHLFRHLLGALYSLWIGLFPVPRHFKPVALCLWALTL